MLRLSILRARNSALDGPQGWTEQLFSIRANHIYHFGTASTSPPLSPLVPSCPPTAHPRPTCHAWKGCARGARGGGAEPTEALCCGVRGDSSCPRSTPPSPKRSSPKR